MLQPTPSTGLNRWFIRLLTLLLAGLAAASVVFWVLHWPAKGQGTLKTAVVTTAATADTGKVASLLGATALAARSQTGTTHTSTDYKLLGVIAQSGASQQGLGGSALIAVKGASAKPYRIGEVIADDLVLQSVRARSAQLGRSGQNSGTITLELPPRPGMADKP